MTVSEEMARYAGIEVRGDEDRKELASRVRSVGIDQGMEQLQKRRARQLLCHRRRQHLAENRQ